VLKKCPSMWQQMSGFLAKIIVRLWPNRTKQWGQAFEAELSEITEPLASVCWLVGGAMLLTRERWQSFVEGLARPIGVPYGSLGEMPGNKKWSRAPHTPRWATILLVLASAAIVMHPEVRETFISVWENYTSPNLEPSRWGRVKKLRKEAEINRDPQLLAWLSLLSRDPAERIRLSEEAIEKDSSLTWLDYEQAVSLSNDFIHEHSLGMDRIGRVQRWDSDNAVPHILMAEVISAPLRSEALPGQTTNCPKSGWEKKLTQDSRWLAEMEKAFSTLKYDNYMLQKFRLASAISRKYGIADPYLSLYIVMSTRIHQYEMLDAYADYLLDVGRDAERRGNTSGAAVAYWQILRFSGRLSTGQQPIETMFATSMGMKAGAKLQPVLKKLDRADEARLVEFQMASWAAMREQQLKKHPAPRGENWRVVRRDALTIQVFAFAVVLLSAMFVVSQVFVWLGTRIPLERRGKGYAFFCRMADVGPLLIVLSSTMQFFVYHPYARAYKNYLSHQWLPDIDSMFVVGHVTRMMPLGLLQYRFEAAMVFWTTVTVGLTLLVIFVCFRMLTREIAARFR